VRGRVDAHGTVGAGRATKALPDAQGSIKLFI